MVVKKSIEASIRKMVLQMHTRKAILDKILAKYEVTIVGTGYIDIIVSRDNYKVFVEEIIGADFTFSTITWWDYCTNNTSQYGLGGPKRSNNTGWYSEITFGEDNIEFDYGDKNQAIEKIIQLIESKELKFFNGEIISFLSHKSLTPAFWIDIADEES